MDVFVWTFDHWLTLSLAIIVATTAVAIVRVLRYAPIIEDDEER